MSLRDAINMVRFGDPVKAIEAFNAGAAAARAEGWDDIPLPHDSVYEAVIDGTPVRVLMVEPVRDDAV